MASDDLKPQRPLLITLMCVFFAVGIISGLASLLITPVYEQFVAPMLEQYPSWYRYLMMVNIFTSLACVVGLWLMKRWSVFLYVASAIVNQIAAVSMGEWIVSSLLMPAIVIAIMVKFYSDMR